MGYRAHLACAAGVSASARTVRRQAKVGRPIAELVVAASAAHRRPQGPVQPQWGEWLNDAAAPEPADLLSSHTSAAALRTLPVRRMPAACMRFDHLQLASKPRFVVHASMAGNENPHIVP